MEETDAVKIIKTLKKYIYSKLEKHDRPVNDFLWLCEVEKCVLIK